MIWTGLLLQWEHNSVLSCAGDMSLVRPSFLGRGQPALLLPWPLPVYGHTAVLKVTLQVFCFHLHICSLLGRENRNGWCQSLVNG